jgi:hypothetical protein
MTAWVAVLLAVLAEASWLAVIAGLLQAFALQGQSIGIAGLYLAALLGVAAARRLAPRLGGRWPVAAGLLAVLVGISGWLASPAVREILATQGLAGLGPALGANPGGWVAWIAFVRGLAYAQLPLDQRRVATMMAVAIPGIAIATLVGGAVAEPWKGQFQASVALDTAVFLASAIPALALARVAAMGEGAGEPWRRNPGWILVLVLLLAVAAVVAVVVAISAGQVFAIAASALVAPLLLIGLVVGFDRRSLRILVVSVLAAAVLASVIRALDGNVGSEGAGTSAATVTTTPTAAGSPVVLAILVVALIVAVIVVIALAWLWMARPRMARISEDEVRVIDRGGREPGSPVRGRRRRGHVHTTVVDARTAYVALLEELAGRGPVARTPDETPAEHAARLRAGGDGGLALDLLAADYQLAAYGGVGLSHTEEVRALARAKALRRTIGRSRSRERKT